MVRATMTKVHDPVVLMKELPDYGLAKGDLGTVVWNHGDSQGFEVEFTDLLGNTIAVITLAENEIRAVTARDVPHVRVA